ncbi:general secretion pathway protein GspB [Marinobacter sp. NFXS9]|uniref:general secretion pathway protein GspB n=1 Tax=Marinobacter sp. NFXS9 TaxID=2818433 RepID=UPI0032DF4748
MSYILDALRKSESDRQQGRVPDLAQSVQMVHKPRRRSMPVGGWVAIALVFNGLILAAIFWPGSGFLASSVDKQASAEPAAEEAPKTSAKEAASETVAPPVESKPAVQSQQQAAADTQDEAPTVITPSISREEPAATYAEEEYPEAVGASTASDEPTLIVPSHPDASTPALPASSFDFADGPPVEHLVEKPIAFQRKIPDLHFSSHIYASDPAARRVMINGNYLRPGDSFSGIRVEAITSDGVILSAYGETFRVGVVRDWTSPR